MLMACRCEQILTIGHIPLIRKPSGWSRIWRPIKVKFLTKFPKNPKRSTFQKVMAADQPNLRNQVLLREYDGL